MQRSALASTFVVLVSATSVVACQIPVFRYALERWALDEYEIIVMHDGPLSKTDQSRVDAFRKKMATRGGAVNAVVRAVDMVRPADRTAQDRSLQDLWEEHGASGAPVAAVLYPKQAREIHDRMIQVTALADASMESICDSPNRQEIAKRLLSGESAVWVFVPCGDRQQDEAALKTLQREIRINEQRLELPVQDNAATDDVSIEATHIELRISFSILTVDRDDPREQFLVNSLLHSESDLMSLEQPMAFPVLGRGRVLYALVGKGISADTIAMASHFVVGPCSCQVKNLNPGFDLLLSVDWDKHLKETENDQDAIEAPSEPVLLTIPPGR